MSVVGFGLLFWSCSGGVSLDPAVPVGKLSPLGALPAQTTLFIGGEGRPLSEPLAQLWEAAGQPQPVFGGCDRDRTCQLVSKATPTPSGVDVASLEGLIPQGDLWVLERGDPQSVLQLKLWLLAQASFETTLPLSDAIEAAALSVTKSPPEARLRLTCVDPRSARVIEAALRAAQKGRGQPPDVELDAVLRDARLVRVGKQLDVIAPTHSAIMEALYHR